MRDIDLLQAKITAQMMEIRMLTANGRHNITLHNRAMDNARKAFRKLQNANK